MNGGAQDTEKVRKLFDAVVNSDVAAVEALLDGGVNIDCVDPAGKTPLRVAVEVMGELPAEGVAMLLVRRGADLLAAGGIELLCQCADHEPLMNAVLDRGLGAGGTSRLGPGPMWHAAGSCSPALLRRLADAGADIHAVSEASAMNAVGAAAASWRAENVSLLIEMGADIGYRGHNGTGFFHCLAHVPRGDQTTEALSELLDIGLRHNLDINARDGAGRTALYQFAVHGMDSAVREMLERGADPDAADNTGATPYLAAAEEWNLEVLGTLARAGANTRARCRNGETALHRAAARNHFWWDHGVSDFASVVDLLTHAGLDVDARNRSGMTALMLAAVDQEPDRVSALLMRGANPVLKCRSGRTARDMAAQAAGGPGTGEEGALTVALLDAWIARGALAANSRS